jgi:hypothetical protein
MPGFGQPPTEQAFAGGPFINTGPSPAADEPTVPFPAIQTEPHTQPAAAAAAAPETAPKTEQPAPAAVEEKKEPRIVRIPCPQGHELQTPMDMVNQEVLCPICGTQFYLRYEDSIEFKQEQAELRRRKAESLNQAALKWSIITAVVIVLAILGMIIYAVVHSGRDEHHVPTDESTAPAATEPAADSGATDKKSDSAEGTGSTEPESTSDSDE